MFFEHHQPTRTVRDCRSRRKTDSPAAPDVLPASIACCLLININVKSLHFRSSDFEVGCKFEHEIRQLERSCGVYACTMNSADMLAAGLEDLYGSSSNCSSMGIIVPPCQTPERVLAEACLVVRSFPENSRCIACQSCTTWLILDTMESRKHVHLPLKAAMSCAPPY